MTNYELEKCIKDYMNGNENGFVTMYNETRKLVFLSIYPIITDNDTIEDLMQDTYMKVIRNLDTYKFGTNFKAWISSISRNLALNEYKRRKSILNLDEIDSEIFTFDRDNDSLIDKSLNLLNSDFKMRQIFIYKIIFNMNIRDIAKIMEMPKSTTYDIYKKAITIIKNNLEDF